MRNTVKANDSIDNYSESVMKKHRVKSLKMYEHKFELVFHTLY